MKHYLLAAALICFGSLTHAAPYFRFLRPLDEVKTGAFIKIGTPNDNVTYGLQTTLVKHRAEDGYFLLPGVSWALLDVGGAKSPEGRLTLVAGPSVDLSEPVKAALLSGFNRLWPTSMGAVKALLAPAQAGKACLAASLGPGFAADLGNLSAARGIRGALVLHAGLSAKW
jgi:hypothetical protein